MDCFFGHLIGREFAGESFTCHPTGAASTAENELK